MLEDLFSNHELVSTEPTWVSPYSTDLQSWLQPATFTVAHKSLAQGDGSPPSS